MVFGLEELAHSSSLVALHDILNRFPLQHLAADLFSAIFVAVVCHGVSHTRNFATVILNKLYNFWVHQQHVGKISWMDGWLNTPSNHRVHHGRNPQYIDKNFGGIFILWDKLFGTYEKEIEAVSFGVGIDPEPLSPREVLAMGFKPGDASPATPGLQKPQT
jgi:sterol desaturase/sphingolipid hydroxylase (fatty acid hydroxylase superfamily)